MNRYQKRCFEVKWSEERDQNRDETLHVLYRSNTPTLIIPLRKWLHPATPPETGDDYALLRYYATRAFWCVDRYPWRVLGPQNGGRRPTTLGPKVTLRKVTVCRYTQTVLESPPLSLSVLACNVAHHAIIILCSGPINTCKWFRNGMITEWGQEGAKPPFSGVYFGHF